MIYNSKKELPICFFAGINHNVDELLIGILSQLKLRREKVREKRSTKVRFKRKYLTQFASCFQ